MLKIAYVLDVSPSLICSDEELMWKSFAVALFSTRIS